MQNGPLAFIKQRYAKFMTLMSMPKGNLDMNQIYLEK